MLMLFVFYAFKSERNKAAAIPPCVPAIKSTKRYEKYPLSPKIMQHKILKPIFPVDLSSFKLIATCQQFFSSSVHLPTQKHNGK